MKIANLHKSERRLILKFNHTAQHPTMKLWAHFNEYTHDIVNGHKTKEGCKKCRHSIFKLFLCKSPCQQKDYGTDRKLKK